MVIYRILFLLVTLTALVGLLNNLLEKQLNGLGESINVMNKIKSLHTVSYSPTIFFLHRVVVHLCIQVNLFIYVLVDLYNFSSQYSFKLYLGTIFYYD